MFFCISNEQFQNNPLTQFKEKIGDFYLELDDGWQIFNNTRFKGYCLEQNLRNKVMDKDFSEQTGNYTIIEFSNGVCNIHYDNSRSYPLYYDQKTLTNLNLEMLTPIWYDGGVYFDNNQWNFRYRTENKIRFDSAHKTFNRSTLADIYCEYLVHACQSLRTNLNIFCADSNGVDTTAIRSALDYCGISYKLVKSTPNDLSYIGWGYNQLYIDNISHMQITGFCGDELLLRNPHYCQILLDSEGIDLIKEFDNLEYSYMKGFFNQKYKEKLAKRNICKEGKKDCFEQVANIMVNDFQMWHYNRILTFTPYRNIDIAVKCLYADVDTILDQVLHAGVSKDIIKRLNPSNLKTISNHKNNYQ